MKTKLSTYLFQRLSESSTWRGLLMLMTAAGIAITPEQTDAIVDAGLAVIGFIGVFFPDKHE